MTASILLMEDTNKQYNVKGEPVRIDEWYGTAGGNYTVALHYHNLQGRILIEASLAKTPQSHADWFPIWLTPTTPYVQYPKNRAKPTNQSIGYIGDTGVDGYAFSGNFTWLRAILDRSYLKPEPQKNDYETIASFGVVKKIILTR